MFSIMNKYARQNITITPDTSKEALNSLSKLLVLSGNLTIQNMNPAIMPSLNLHAIEGNVIIENSKFYSALPNLTIIDGNLVLKNACITAFNGLEKVDGNLCMKDSTISHLPSLKTVGQNMAIDGSILIHVPALKTVGQSVCARNSHIVNMQSLDLQNCKTNLQDTRITHSAQPSTPQR